MHRSRKLRCLVIEPYVAVPDPASAALLALGLTVLGPVSRSRE